MAGTIVTDRIESDASYASSINIASPLVVANTVTFTGTGRRITGDFNNATVANRVMFQNSVTNGATQVSAIPNGTSAVAGFIGINNSDPTNASFAQFRVQSDQVVVNAGITGTGTYLPITFLTNGSERMRIDTSGNVGIGTSLPVAKLHSLTSGASNGTVDSRTGLHIQATNVTTGFANARIQFSYAVNTPKSYIEAGVFGADYLAFGKGDGSAEAMRIDSNGNLLVGKATLNTTGNGFTVEPNANGAGIPGSWLTGNSTNDVHGGYHMYSSSSSSYKFYATYAGKVYAVTTTIQGISDQRLKENIEDIDVGLEQILALRPRKFDWKEGKGKDIKGDRGWIAQEFEQVFPEMVDTWLDEPPEGEEPYKSVGADLIPVLVKAIQELKAELDTVKAELATLKG